MSRNTELILENTVYCVLSYCFGHILTTLTCSLTRHTVTGHRAIQPDQRSCYVLARLQSYE